MEMIDGKTIITIQNSIVMLIWAWAIIPLVVVSFIGFMTCPQCGGNPEYAGAKYWAPASWALTVGWVLFWIVKGIFRA